jgi:PAS domain S-box-containing protein
MAVATVEHTSHWLVEYGLKPAAIAIMFVIVALLWTFPLQHLIAYPFVFLFFGAIMGSAWFGGVIAGTWAIVLSSVAIDFFFIPPLYSFVVNKELTTYYDSFVVCAIAITAISAARRRAEHASIAARSDLEEKVRERTFELERSNLETLERERQLRLLTEAIPQQIWRADANGHIEYCNQDLVNFTGESHDNLCGGSFLTIFHSIDASVFQRTWEIARSTGTRFEIEARVHDARGNFRWFLIRGIPQYTASGEIASWYGVHIDIEERHHAEHALRIAHDDSARWSRTLSMAEMAASIAHELKQPLTALMTQAQACRRWLHADPINSEKATHAAENLVRESARASAVVDRVRSLFSEKDTIRQLTDLNLLAAEVVELMQDEALRRGVDVRLEFGKNIPRAKVDPIQVRQLLLNLVTNGIESTMDTGRPGQVVVRSNSTDQVHVILSVLDNGIGIRPEVQEKMFEPFFSTKQRGTGIGLSICRSIVEAHDGRIWTESLPAGTAFHVALGAGE